MFPSEETDVAFNFYSHRMKWVQPSLITLADFVLRFSSAKPLLQRKSGQDDQGWAFNCLEKRDQESPLETMWGSNAWSSSLEDTALIALLANFGSGC